MNKYQTLLSQPHKLFHASDLALLWEIDNKDTLNMTLKRYVDRGILRRIHKGFYTTTDLDHLDLIDLGFSYLHVYGYLSLESILVREGVIFQETPYITFVSSKSTTFSIGERVYKSRQLKDVCLLNTLGIEKVAGHYEANLNRAVADMLYYNPQYHFDATSAINFDAVATFQKEIGYVKSE
ncbi:MAG: hypothetical protein GW946_00740 [Candidatus Pacebacteria bacterium]|nr:hypothetical protein [Candidatus Paceibacterota bacterium]PIR60859.1 MAG: hypothetical protein COU67_00175 [Candidatus Pacebacteria bacterium CG10_big_fil_rev_8_21_14_0_10_44_54]